MRSSALRGRAPRNASVTWKLLAPANELGDDVVGKLEREEEPETVIFLDGSRSAHVGV
jgi:hypothetical protein